MPTLWLTVDGVAAFAGDPAWYRGFLYATERDRGYDHVGNRFCPGRLELDLPPHGEATAAFALGEPCAHAASAFDQVAATAEQQWAPVLAADGSRAARLAIGADLVQYEKPGIQQ